MMFHRLCTKCIFNLMFSAYDGFVGCNPIISRGASAYNFVCVQIFLKSS